MTFFVQQKVFNSIPQEGLEMYFTRKFTYEKAPRRAELTQVFIESVMYKYLATVEAGRDYEAAFVLAQEKKNEETWGRSPVARDLPLSNSTVSDGVRRLSSITLHGG
jgi:hypothetical protein